jgi:hypothetical protein
MCNSPQHQEPLKLKHGITRGGLTAHFARQESGTWRRNLIAGDFQPIITPGLRRRMWTFSLTGNFLLNFIEWRQGKNLAPTPFPGAINVISWSKNVIFKCLRLSTYCLMPLKWRRRFGETTDSLRMEEQTKTAITLSRRHCLRMDVKLSKNKKKIAAFFTLKNDEKSYKRWIKVGKR